VKRGELNAGYLNVESEFAATSAVIGASATGARAYTATASQGLLYMSEAVHNAAGLGLPARSGSPGSPPSPACSPSSRRKPAR